MTKREEIIRTPEQREAHKVYRTSLKREEIREGIAQGIRLGICAYQHLGFDNAEMYNKIADEIIKRLHSQRVAIKVERELPEWLKFKWANNPCITSQDDIDKAFTFDIVEDAGLVFTEPLIEEGA